MESIVWKPRPREFKDPHGRLKKEVFPDQLIDGCLVSETAVENLTSVSRDGQITSWDVHISRQFFPIKRGDTVIIRGEKFVVEKNSFDWQPARRRRSNRGTMFTAVRSEG